jgi:hypothetical protein
MVDEGGRILNYYNFKLRVRTQHIGLKRSGAIAELRFKPLLTEAQEALFLAGGDPARKRGLAPVTFIYRDRSLYKSNSPYPVTLK